MSKHAVSIRTSNPTDTDVLANFATLGARPYVPGARGLVAEVDGTPIAAISLTSGAVAADPERAHSGVVDSLRYRRYQILRQGGDLGRARNVLRRLAPARRAPQESPT